MVGRESIADVAGRVIFLDLRLVRPMCEYVATNYVFEKDMNNETI